MKSALFALLVLFAALPASAQRTATPIPRISTEAARASGDMRPILTTPDFTAEQAIRVRDARREERRARGRDLVPALVPAFEARMDGRTRTAGAATEAALAVLHANERLAGRTHAEIDLAIMDLVLEASSGALNAVGEDAQLANVDMQSALQRQQQALQMLSNVSKRSHDTTKAILNNLKG